MKRRILLARIAVSSMLSIPAIPSQAGSRPGRVTHQPNPAQKKLRLRHAATGARFSGVYHGSAGYDPIALQELSAVLADTRTGTVHDYDPKVLDILWEVTRRLRTAEEVVVLSGFRTPGTNAAVEGAADSQHLRAAAIDVQLSAAKLPVFSETALTLNVGGVGIYAKRGFVHLDSGPVRRWGELPGKEAQPPEDPLARMAEAWGATLGRRP